MFDYIGVIATMKELCRTRKKEDMLANIRFYYGIFLFSATITSIALFAFSSLNKWVIVTTLLVLFLIRFVLHRIGHIKATTELEKMFNTNYKLGCLVSDYLGHVVEKYEDGKYNDVVCCEAYPCLALNTPIKVEILVRYLLFNEEKAFGIKEKLEKEAKMLQNSFCEVAKAEVFVRFVPYKD